MNNRIKELRDALGLTLEKFGARLGVGKTAIHKLEKGENHLTDQMIKAICREFDVDYGWFTTGKGEMFIKSDDFFYEKIDRIMAGENEFHKNIIKAATELSIEELKTIETLMNKCLASQKEED